MADWVDAAVKQVMDQLRAKDPRSDRDVYVWSDGTVSGPRDSDSRVSDERVVSVFTPGEQSSEAAIRASIVKGLEDTRGHGRDI